MKQDNHIGPVSAFKGFRLSDPLGHRSRDPFADPRGETDRRHTLDSHNVPKTGCRREIDRRTTVYLKCDEWWMKRNYIGDETAGKSDTIPVE